MHVELLTWPHEVPIVQINRSIIKSKEPLWMNLTRIKFVVDGVQYEIDPGFVTNLGSVPKLVRHVVDPADESSLGFVIHDYLYSKANASLSRKQADEVLHLVIRMCRQDRVEAYITWLGVRVGGWTQFGNAEAQFLEVPKSLLEKICADNNFNYTKQQT